MTTNRACLQRSALFTLLPGLAFVAAGCPPEVATLSDPTIETQSDGDESLEGQALPEAATVKILVEGPGSVAQEAVGCVVTLTATAEPGWVFDGWSGSTVCDRNPLTIYVTDSTSLTAHFVELVLDEDFDGVRDEDDECPYTPFNEEADQTSGCSCSQLDDDDDGISNCTDECPTTAAEESVNTVGCSCSQLDDDQDGVSNCDDLCPTTPYGGGSVNEEGCGPSERDTDSDGIRDHLDECPDTAFGAHVNAHGCPPVCGNGLVEFGEECEPPDSVSCDSDCQAIPPVCGNGVVEAGEECEPPNTATCSALCQQISTAVCGNGIVEAGEQCDPPNGTTCDASCQTISGQGPTTWSSTQMLLLSGDYYSVPETYDISSNGSLTTAHVTPNTAAIEYYWGGDATALSTNIPVGVETTIFRVDDLGGVPGESLTESATINTFTLGISSETATWTFNYVLRDRYQSAFWGTYAIEYRVIGEQTGTVSGDGTHITWTGVSGTLTVCDELWGCEDYSLQEWSFLGSWTKVGG